MRVKYIIGKSFASFYVKLQMSKSSDSPSLLSSPERKASSEMCSGREKLPQRDDLFSQKEKMTYEEWGRMRETPKCKRCKLFIQTVAKGRWIDTI